MNIAEYAAVNPGTRSAVAIFSMEMPSEQLLTRMLSSIGGVQLNAIRSGQISDEDWVRVTAATSQLAEARIYIDESAGLTPTELPRSDSSRQFGHRTAILVRRLAPMFH